MKFHCHYCEFEESIVPDSNDELYYNVTVGNKYWNPECEFPIEMTQFDLQQMLDSVRRYQGKVASLNFKNKMKKKKLMYRGI